LKTFYYILSIFVAIVLALIACKKEENNFNVNPIINITVVDEQGTTVSGATISVYENDIDYATAILTRNFSASRFTSAISDANGKANVQLIAGKEFYILVTTFDNVRFLNLSNISLGGYISGNDLKQRQTLFLRVSVTPDDGNIIFYTTATNKLPIIINLSNTISSNATQHTLTGVYGFTDVPTVKNLNTVSLYRDQGTYRYFAKSADGCIWVDTLTVIKGEIKLVNLSKCESGTISFYSSAVNDTLMPISVRINTVDSIGSISNSLAAYTCANLNNSALTVVRYKGLYNYFIKSRSGRCVWTGTVSLTADACVVVPIEVCE